MKNLKSINEFWGAVIRRDMSSAVREEDSPHTKEELIEYLEREIKRQGKNVVIKNLDVSGIKDLSGLFSNINIMNNVKTLDLSGWNTEGVTNMKDMFQFLPNIESINLSGWKTNEVTKMNSMFSRCENLKSLDLSGWETDNLTDISYMFKRCEKLESLDLSGWNSNNIKFARFAFSEMKSIKSLDLSGWTYKICSATGIFSGTPMNYIKM